MPQPYEMCRQQFSSRSNAIYREGCYSEELTIEVPTNERNCWPQNMGGQVFIFKFFMNPMAINLPAMSGTARENVSRGL